MRKGLVVTTAKSGAESMEQVQTDLYYIDKNCLRRLGKKRKSWEIKWMRPEQGKRSYSYVCGLCYYHGIHQLPEYNAMQLRKSLSKQIRVNLVVSDIFIAYDHAFRKPNIWFSSIFLLISHIFCFSVVSLPARRHLVVSVCYL